MNIGSRRVSRVASAIASAIESLESLGPAAAEHVQYLKLLPPLPEVVANDRRNEHFSVSRVKTHEECPGRYDKKYVKKLPVLTEVAIPPELGKLLHKCNELTNKWIVTECYEGPYPGDKLLEIYKQQWPNFGLHGSDVFADGMTALRTFIASQKSVDHMRILAIEKSFEIMFDEYKFIGFIDLVERLDFDTIRIVDYKSNRLLYSAEELNHDLQMSIYGLAVQEIWPWVKRIEYEFVMLRHGLTQRTRRNQQQLQDAKAYAVAHATKMETDTEFKDVINPNCPNCDFRSVCDAYKKALEGKDEKLAYTKDDFDKLGAAYAQAERLAKIYYARKKEIEDIMQAHLEHVDVVHAGPKTFRFSSQQNRFFPVMPTLGVLARHTRKEVNDLAKELNVGVPAGEVDAVVDLVREQVGRAMAGMLETSLEAVTEIRPFRKIDVKASKGGGTPSRSLPAMQPEHAKP